MAAVALWSRIVKPGEKATFHAQADCRITSAALDAVLVDPKGRTSVKLSYQTLNEEDDDDLVDAETILCSLTPEKVEQCALDITIPGDDEVTFEVVGKNSVYITGNYIAPDNGMNDEDDFDSDVEEDYDLNDVSSDVEIDPAMLDDVEMDSDEEDDSHRFEEVKDEEEVSKPAPAKKRARESDAAEEAEGEKLSKKQKKKLNKKLKEDVATTDAPAPVISDKPAEKKKEKSEKPKEKDSSAKGELKTTSSGLKVKDVKEGSGKSAKSGDLVSMRFVGKLEGGKIFDSNTKGKPFTFRLGAGEVIKGWDEGIAGMKVGGERLLVLPPKLGYGGRKMSDIPANSTLRFECKLLEIKG